VEATAVDGFAVGRDFARQFPQIGRGARPQPPDRMGVSAPGNEAL